MPGMHSCNPIEVVSDAEAISLCQVDAHHVSMLLSAECDLHIQFTVMVLRPHSCMLANGVQHTREHMQQSQTQTDLVELLWGVPNCPECADPCSGSSASHCCLRYRSFVEN